MTPSDTIYRLTMNRDNILADLNVIFRKLLKNQNIRLSENMTDEDIDDWDSLAHIQIVVAIETLYHIRFTTGEIQKQRSIRNLLDIIEPKLAARHN